MTTVQFNSSVTDEQRRRAIFDGEFFVYSAHPSVVALCNHAKTMIAETFPDEDPETAQYRLEVEQFAARVAPLKSRFTNDLTTKKLIRDILYSFNYNIDDTFFDVPRLRVVTSDNFLTAGVGYAYKAHRDTWYSSPESQINWWLPVFDLAVERTLAFYPKYWTQTLKNTSGGFDYGEWVRVARGMAASQIRVDTRNHPVPTEPVDAADEMRIVLKSAESILFSASHVHATVPNCSGRTRFSLDFRTVHINDLRTNVGSPNIDNRSRGSTLGDFLRATDFSPLTAVFSPEALIRPPAQI